MSSFIEMLRTKYHRVKDLYYRDLFQRRLEDGGSAPFLQAQMDKFRVDSLKNQTPREFQARIRGFLGLVDGEMEGFAGQSYQRDLSIKFHWGHNHDFGDFALKGKMGNRHINLLATFMDQFGVLPRDLTGKRILDIGCWTGGTSLILSALGAEVVAIEEVKKYAECLNYLIDAFGITNLSVENISLYEIPDEFSNRFDYVLFAGVLYHVSDPIIACRITFNCLKDGGYLLLETQAANSSRPLLIYEGPRVFVNGSEERLNRTGWNWFSPSPLAVERILHDVGYSLVEVGKPSSSRLHAVARKDRQVDFLRSGLSRRDIR